MFSAFFYLLRARGLDISMKEWLTLIEALKMGLHGSSMKGFYNPLSGSPLQIRVGLRPVRTRRSWSFSTVTRSTTRTAR